VVGLHFLDRFPNGWDSAEYALCVRDGRLPHGPYIVYLLAGRLLGSFFDAPLALSLLSLISGLGGLVLLFAVRLREGAAVTGALAAVALLASMHLFVRQASTQEIYALQTAALLATILTLSVRGRRSAALAGVFFGTAVGVHFGSLFVAPALFYRCATANGRRGALRWAAWSTAVIALWIGVTAWLLPAEAGTDGLARLLLYLRGLPPGQPLQDPGLLGSLLGLVERLTSRAVPMDHGPMATGPTGITATLCAAAAAGALLTARRNRPLAAFWALYPLPYLVYETWIGRGLDWGIYLPMILLPLTVFASELVDAVAGRLSGRRTAPITAVLLVVVLASPSISILRTRWSDPELDAIRHYRPETLAAIWMADHLPANAIVIQSSQEPNANLLPYHARRTHVISDGIHPPMILVDRGPYTPMIPRTFEAFRTESILTLLAQGRPIYAFEREPFRRVRVEFVDPLRFAWEPAGEARPAEVVAALPVDQTVRDRLELAPVPLFRLRAR
jgi:hypothetical protein